MVDRQVTGWHSSGAPADVHTLKTQCTMRTNNRGWSIVSPAHVYCVEHTAVLPQFYSAHWRLLSSLHSQPLPFSHVHSYAHNHGQSRVLLC